MYACCFSTNGAEVTSNNSLSHIGADFSTSGAEVEQNRSVRSSIRNTSAPMVLMLQGCNPARSIAGTAQTRNALAELRLLITASHREIPDYSGTSL